MTFQWVRKKMTHLLFFWTVSLTTQLHVSNSRTHKRPPRNQQQKQQQQETTCSVDGTCVVTEEKDDRTMSSAPPTTTTTIADETTMIHPECGLYLAQSTIPGAGMGIFTAVAKTKGDSVGWGDMCIPLVDMYWHHEWNFNPLKDYFWAGQFMGMSDLSSRDDIEALCPGLDCAINCHLGLINVQRSVPHYQNTFHRSTDPAAGSSTPYHSGPTHVSRDIPAGAELFKDYGDHWFTIRTKEFGMIPLSADYRAANELLSEFYNVAVTKETKLQHELYQTVRNTTNVSKRTYNALPRSVEDALMAGQARDLAVTLQPQHTHEMAYLQQHGVCIDHIRPGPSTLANAGQGAFAVRSLAQNQVITVSPVHHLMTFQALEMYNFTEIATESDDHQWLRLVDEVTNMQLYYNYCYGVSDSTILFCPYGAGVNYLNHDSLRANVRVEWATGFSFHNDTLVKVGTVDDLGNSHKPRLAFRYVATKDIQPGDELFLDYGPDWQSAWIQHTAEYERDEKTSTYASARLWNSVFSNMPVRTVDEVTIDPYPDNLHIRCHRALLLHQQLNRYREYGWTDSDYGLTCRVMDRFHENGLELYTVIVEVDPEDDQEDDEEEGNETDNDTVTWLDRTDVPRSALRFFDMPYTTDILQDTAFRHEIGFPNALFPDQWRNW